MKAFALVICALAALQAHAQQAEIDRTFAAGLHQRCDSTVVTASASVVHRANGASFFGRVLRYVDGRRISFIGRLEENDQWTNIYQEEGSGSSQDLNVRYIASYDNDRMVCALVTSDNNSKIIRIDDDGRIDETFISDSIPRGVLSALAIDLQGRILIGGSFTTDRGVLPVLRLQADGTLDASYTPPVLRRFYVTRILPLPNGSCYIGGSFDTLQGTTRRALARLRDDGTIDAAFDPNVRPNEVVTSMEIVGTQDLMVSFSQGAGSKRLVRLGPDGARVESFPEVDLGNHYLYDLLRTPDDRILAAGFTSAAPGMGSFGLLAYVTPDGRLDTTAFTGVETASAVYDVSLDASGRLHLLGMITSVDGRARQNYARLLPAWNLDTTFMSTCGLKQEVHELATLSDGTFLLGGPMIAVDEASTGPMLRIDRQGSLAEGYRGTFVRPGLRGLHSVDQVQVDAQDRAIFIALESTTNTGSAGSLRRMLPTGELDTTFRVDPGLDDSVRIATLLTDGRIAIAGTFRSVDGVSRNGIAVLDANGRLDASFDPGAGIDITTFPIRSIAQASNGDLYVVGQRFGYDGGTPSYIQRIALTGRAVTSFDPTFTLAQSVGEPAITHVKALPDGGCYIIGTFEVVSDRIFSNAVRLTPVGALNISFTPSVILPSTAVLVDGWGRLYMAGRQIVRVDTTGVVDETVNIMFDDYVYDMALVDTTSLVVAGRFQTDGSVVTPYVAKIRLADIPSRVQELAATTSISITPHPVSGRAVCSLPPDQGAVVVTVTDMCGREMLRQQVLGEVLEIATDGWAPGLYSVRALGRTTMSVPMMVTR